MYRLDMILFEVNNELFIGFLVLFVKNLNFCVFLFENVVYNFVIMSCF